MNKNSKLAKHQPLHKNGDTQEKVSSTSPSIDINGKAVAENDNSANLFEDHIRQQENKSQR